MLLFKMQEIRYRLFGVLILLFIVLSGINAQQSLDSVIQEARKDRDYESLAVSYLQRAENQLHSLYDSKEVFRDLNQSNVYYRYLNDSIGLHKVQMLKAQMYMINENYLIRAERYTLASLDYFERHKMEDYTAKAHNLLSMIYDKRLDYEKALRHISKSLHYAERIDDVELQLENGVLMSNFLRKMGEIDQAILLNQLNLERSCQLGNADLTFQYYKQLGDSYIEKENYDEALYHYRLAEQLNVSNLDDRADLYKAISQLYAMMDDYAFAFDYSTKFQKLSSDLNKRNQLKITNMMYLNSETAEKEQEIVELEKETEKKQTQLQTQKRFLFLLAFGTVVSLIAIFYVVRFYNQKIRINQLISRQKEEINDQKINKLEDEMRIKSLSSMVDGQETERNRIATDLHDSLGGTLSALKLQFESFAFETASEKVPKYGIIYNMIDNACSEVRQIARNLKPLALEKIGLIPAIRDIINKYNSSSEIEFSFYTNIKGEVEIDYDTKVNIYRIIQELLNNAFKHSQANEVDVQLTRQFGDILITVEDDGVGFDPQIIDKGIGLDSVQSRVNIMRSEITIDSKKGHGTTILVTIPLV